MSTCDITSLQGRVNPTGNVFPVHRASRGHHIRVSTQHVSLLSGAAPYNAEPVCDRAADLPLPLLPLHVRLLCHLQAGALQLLPAGPEV